MGLCILEFSLYKQFQKCNISKDIFPAKYLSHFKFSREIHVFTYEIQICISVKLLLKTKMYCFDHSLYKNLMLGYLKSNLQSISQFSEEIIQTQEVRLIDNQGSIQKKKKKCMNFWIFQKIAFQFDMGPFVKCPVKYFNYFIVSLSELEDKFIFKYINVLKRN